MPPGWLEPAAAASRVEPGSGAVSGEPREAGSSLQASSSQVGARPAASCSSRRDKGAGESDRSKESLASDSLESDSHSVRQKLVEQRWFCLSGLSWFGSVCLFAWFAWSQRSYRSNRLTSLFTTTTASSPPEQQRIRVTLSAPASSPPHHSSPQKIGSSASKPATSVAAQRPLLEAEPVEAPNRQQLAIYINGKIRSNSIFCRSTSSGSFGGLLGRLSHLSGAANEASGSAKHQELASAPKWNSNADSKHSECDQRKWVPGDQQQQRPAPSGLAGLLAGTLGRLSLAPPPSPAANNNNNKAKADQANTTTNVGSYKLNPSSMFLRKAMRYYRLWIYSASALIFLAALVFILATLYVASDFRFRLLVAPEGEQAEVEERDEGGEQRQKQNNQNHYDLRIGRWEPSVLLAYAAIAVQAGLLQAVGCFGAVRMRERWIQAFWYLILALTLFDLGFLLYWLARYDTIGRSLRHQLAERVQQHYGHQLGADPNTFQAPREANTIEMDKRLDKILTEILDKIQSESQCCGVSSALDYKRSRWRRIKMAQLVAANQSNQLPRRPIQLVPLVPAACCRRMAPKPLKPEVPKAIQTTAEQGVGGDGDDDDDDGDGARDDEQRQQQAKLDLGGSPGRRRLLAKQYNYNLPALRSPPEQADIEPLYEDNDGTTSETSGRLRARWAVEERVLEESQQVLAWLVENEEDKLRANEEDAHLKLDRLRRLLFRTNSSTLVESTTDESNFLWPNQLRLTFSEYKTIENYLLSGSRRQQRPRRELDSQPVPEPQAKNQDWADLIKADPELSCAPKTYYDQQTIYTRGCNLELKHWLDSSARIMFLFGFCILTVLKFCALLLLRLELREMIHKIKVLKGMATEYNALHDLEAYLPRPSVCAQAAELTPTGVALASSASATVATPAGLPPPTRLGGSFSEAVAAATQRQQQEQLAGCQVQASNQLRASSMKAMAAGLLSPAGLCPRSSSASSAHLHHLVAHAGPSAGAPGRRHTAISVCPQAAAAAAAAAAQHLISRRGTCVATPLFPTPAGPPLSSGGFNLSQHRHSAHTVTTLAALNAHHPHHHNNLSHLSSASAALLPQRPQRQQSCHQSRHFLGDQPATGTANSSVESSATTTTSHLQRQQQQQQPQQQQQSRPSADSQLLSLGYPFRRQWSGGAQSAANFSIGSGATTSSVEPPAISSTESRRSIH